MAKAELKNAPRLEGWAIAAGAGAVAFGAAYVPIGVNAAGSVAVGVVLFLVVGLILGLPTGEEPARPAPAAAPQPKPAPRAEAVVAPAATLRSAPVDFAPAAPAARPQGIAAPRNGAPDDLKIIKGIGPKLEVMLHGMGYYHFDQIAAWTEAEIAWVDDNLEGFKGRVTRDEWVAQARALAAGKH